MNVEINVAGAEDEASPKLEGILAHSVLPVAGAPCSFPGQRVVAAEEMEQRRGSEAGRAIRLPPLVNQKGERDTGFLTEQTGVAQVTEPNGGETSPLAPECMLMLAQLRDVLAAEESAVVAKESEDRGAVGPQRAESNLVAFGVGYNDTRELRTERLLHRDSFSAGRAGPSSKVVQPICRGVAGPSSRLSQAPYSPG